MRPASCAPADQIVNLGPGHGATGGNLVFQGTWREILDAPDSLTGQYLSGQKQINIPSRRPVTGVLAPSQPNRRSKAARAPFSKI